MRLPTIYENTADDFVTSTNYPTTDGTPGFAGIGYIPSNGAPASSYSWTTTIYSGHTNYYWRWANTADYDSSYSSTYNIKCVVP